MKFTLKWLREYLDFNCSLDKLESSLTNLGLEVESINNPYQKLKDFKVCIVKKIQKHPNADKLKVCDVFDGKENLKIVCGAANVRENLLTVLAPVGTELPSIDGSESIKIKKSIIRDVQSHGMLCSENELGIGKNSQGIIELENEKLIGKSFSICLDEERVSIEIAITPNRPDCAGVMGVARDLYALGLGKMKASPKINFEKKTNKKIFLSNELKLKDCPQFYLRLVENVKNRMSSKDLQKRFEVCDIKIISSLVDITNFLSFDRCRPLHVFDYDKIQGKIVIRHSKSGEKFTGLDGIDYELSSEMIVICDDIGIISLAGVMGGERTACDLDTKNVLIESAYFSPERIAYTGRKLLIDSDARYRFERGIDPASTLDGLNVATDLIIKNCGGEIHSTVFDGEYKESKKIIKLNISEINSLIGIKFESEFIENKFKLLGCEVEKVNDEFIISPPSWRTDLLLKEDLIEEIARIYGYENIPNQSITFENILKRNVTNHSQKQKKIIRRSLVSYGLTELVTWSFVDEKYEKLFNKNKKLVKVSNPISSEMSCLRSSLAINLLLSIKKNFNRGFSNIGLFELGPIFYGDKPGQQNDCVMAMRTGEEISKNWLQEPRKSDIFDIKDDLFNILKLFNFSPNSLEVFDKEIPEYFHPKKSGTIKVGNKLVASFGSIHPSIIKKFDLDYEVACFEFYLTDALKIYKKRKVSKPVFLPSPYQSSIRDFSFILEKKALSSEIIKIISKVDRVLIKKVKVFDSFENFGKSNVLAENKKALAVEVLIQSDEKTLTEKDIDELSERIIKSVEENSTARLRV